MLRTFASLALILCCSQLFARQEITPPTFGTSAYSINAAFVASNQATILTLWNVSTNFGGSQVYGSLSDAKGNLRTAQSFLVIADAGVQQLIASGSGYIAVVGTPTGRRMAFLSSEGSLLRFGPMAAFPKGVTYALEATNGREVFAVAWRNGFGSSQAETSLQVATVDGSIVRALTPFTRSSLFAVAASANELLVATGESDGVYLHRFGPDGIEVLPVSRVSSSSAFVITITVASSGEETAVAWSENGSAGATAHVAVVSRAGDVRGELQFASPFLGYMKLVVNANSYSLVTSAPALLRFDRTGKVLEGPTTVATFSDVAVNESVTYIVGIAGFANRLVGVPIPPGSLQAAPEPVVLSTMPRRQVWPVLASDGAGFLAVWSDQTAESKTLAAMRLDQNGSPLGASQIDLGIADAPLDDRDSPFASVSRHSVTFGGRTFLAVWQRGSEVVARRVDRFGNLVDPQPIVLGQGTVSDHPAAWNGKSFLVTWTGADFHHGVMIGEDGPATAATKLALGPPVVAWDGTRFLLAAVHYYWPGPLICGCPPNEDGVSLSRLSEDAAPLDAAAAVFTTYSRSLRFRVSTSGREFVIASDVVDYSGGGAHRVELRTIHADRPSLEIGPAARVFQWKQPIISDLTWSGRDYILTLRYGLGTKQFIGLMHLTPDLTPLTRLYTEVAGDVLDRASAATNPAGETIIAISEFPTPGSSARIRTFPESEMKLMPAPPPTPIIASAVGVAQSTTVTWSQPPGSEVSGFVIERSMPGYEETVAIVPALTTRATVVIDANGFLTQPVYLRVRAFNAGGLSAPSASMHVILPLRNRR